MPNTITLTAAKANTSKSIEYLHPTTGIWQDSNVLTNVPAGIYNLIQCRLKGSNPAITASWTQPVTVLGATNQAPSVALSLSTQSTTAGTSVTASALASDSDGTVLKVEFYDGTTLLGTDTDSPYTCSWTPTAGSHSITAKVYDNQNATNVSTAVALTVTATDTAAQPLPTPAPVVGTTTSTAIPVSSPAVANATGYRFQLATDSSFTQNLVTSPDQTSPAYTFTGLGSAKVYYVREQALYTGSGNYSASAYAGAVQATTAAAVAAAAAPANPLVNDSANTLSADLVSGFAALTNYEYSLNGGTSYNVASAGGVIGNGRITVPVGNADKAVGQVLLRVVADAALGRPAGLPASNSVAYTYVAQQLSGVNIVCLGNSIVQGTAGQEPWPSQMAARLNSNYVVNNQGLGGQTLESMIANINTQARDTYNASASVNIAFVMEGTNSLRSGTSASSYYDKLVTYCRSLKQIGYLVVPLTVTPNTITPGANADTNPAAQAINTNIVSKAVQGSGTPDWSYALNLSLNAKVGRFGTAANGQDNTFSSSNSNWYLDGTHPTTLVYGIIGQMAFDVVNYLVNGVAVPDPSNYPQAQLNGDPMTFVGGSAADVAPGSNVVARGNGQFNDVGRSVQQLTAGTGPANDYRGSFYFEVKGAPGFFSVTANGVSGGFGWLQYGPYYPDNAVAQIFVNGGGNGEQFGYAQNGTQVEYRVYKDRIEYYQEDVLKATSGAPTFPCHIGFSLQGANGAGFYNCRAVVIA